MPNRLLVIDGDNHAQFFLSVQDGILTVGTNPTQNAIVLGAMRPLRIHCELEVEQEPVVQGNNLAVGCALGQALQPGQELQLGPSHVRLMAMPETDAGADRELPALDDLSLAKEEPAAEAAPAATAPMVNKRLLVVDGADKGRSFPLNVTGRISVGKSAKHADIVLHDLYVSRVHCELIVDDDGVRVLHVEGQNGTLVNGQKVTTQALHLGDVIRVGNSHLRFEEAAVEAADDNVPELDAEEATDDELVAPISSSLDSLSELEDQVLGQYQFGALLGRGHSGLVFRAHHRQTNQPVTVKVLSPDFPATDAEIQSFIKVMKAVAPLKHPNLVAVQGAGKTGPYCWIAREYVEGESLGSLIERLRTEDRLGWKRACRVAIHLGRLLTFLQQRKVTLSRMTPKNILFETATKATRLADLMLDQALAGSQLAATTAPDRLADELPYRAPEQLEPNAPIDQRTSLYALGTIVYALLAGKPPFLGPTPDATTYQIREARLIKPSRHLRDIPPPFEAAVIKLLARKPEERFQTAADLLAVVQPLAEEHEITV